MANDFALVGPWIHGGLLWILQLCCWFGNDELRKNEFLEEGVFVANKTRNVLGKILADGFYI